MSASSPAHDRAVRRRARTRLIFLAASVAALAAPTSASAAFTPCAANPPAPIFISQIHGASFQGMAVDPQGHLYATDIANGVVYRWDHPGATPTVVTNIPGPGGIAIAPDGTLLIGYGANLSVLIGDLTRPGKIERLNLTTGATTQIASGLSSADGLTLAADGTIYATNDFGSLVGRISPDGEVDPQWAYLKSANGAVLSADGRYLYVSRTFVNPGVSAIPTADPADPISLINLTGSDLPDAFDDPAINSRGQLIVPADVSDEIVRVDGPGQICRLSSAPVGSATLTYGHGTRGFSAGRLFRGGFDGALYEIPAAFDAGGK